MKRIRKKDLLRGAGSVLEVYPSIPVSREVRIQEAKARCAERESFEADVLQLQNDWRHIGSHFRRAIREYEQEQQHCT